MNRWFMVRLLALLLIVSPTWAATVGKGSGLALKRSGSTATAGVVEGSGDFGRLLGGQATGLSDGVLDFQRLTKMPFKLKDLAEDTAEVGGKIKPKEIARALRGGLGAYVAGQAFMELAELACVRLMDGSMQVTESGAWQECVPGSGAPVLSDGKDYRAFRANGMTPWFPTKEEACESARVYVDGWNAGGAPHTAEIYQTGPTTFGCRLRKKDGVQYVASGFETKSSSCPAGWYITPSGCQQDEPVQDVEWRDITPQQAQDKLEDTIKAPGNERKVLDALRDYTDKGGRVEMDEPTVTGPASSPTHTTTTTSVQQTSNGPTTITHTTNTTINYTYNNSTVTARQVSETVSRDENGVEVGRETSEGDADEPPVDTDLPPVPDLYTRKYPEGMVGIWRDFADRLQGSSLGSLVSTLMPAVSDGGTCPSWPLNLNIAEWAAYGTHDVAPPCWIWDVAAAILMLSALLLARALIFGG